MAKKFNGEIVSADSRQVYKKMDIGTAKPIGEWEGKEYLVEGINHHLVDIVDPGKDFSLADYKELARESISNILSRNKLPIIVGGTGLYIQALVDNLDIPKAKPDKSLREKLEKKKLPELVAMLEKMDPDTAQVLDLKNPRRVLRALEVVMQTGQSFFKQRTKSKQIYEVLQIGIDLPREELYSRINLRIDRQIGEGLVEETCGLAKKYEWSLPSMSGIGYRQIGLYLRGEVTLDEAIDILKRDTRRYTKRQMTWFKRDKKIVWVKNTDLALAEKLVKDFLAI